MWDFLITCGRKIVMENMCLTELTTCSVNHLPSVSVSNQNRVYFYMKKHISWTVADVKKNRCVVVTFTFCVTSERERVCRVQSQSEPRTRQTNCVNTRSSCCEMFSLFFLLPQKKMKTKMTFFHGPFMWMGLGCVSLIFIRVGRRN